MYLEKIIIKKIKDVNTKRICLKVNNDLTSAKM